MATGRKVKRMPAQLFGFLAQRNRAGLIRSRNSLPRILRMTLGAIGAFWIAESIWGHSQPIFAATSALELFDKLLPLSRASAVSA